MSAWVAVSQPSLINGAIGQSNTLDLSSASGTLAVNMATTPER
jgi:hypothetical protein